MSCISCMLSYFSTSSSICEHLKTKVIFNFWVPHTMSVKFIINASIGIEYKPAPIHLLWLIALFSFYGIILIFYDQITEFYD